MTREASLGEPVLAKFLIRYQESNCFYDWGDDPSFFAATELLGEPGPRLGVSADVT